MTVEVAVAALKAWPAVTAIVGTGTAAKISPLIRAQAIEPPCVTVQRISTVPQNALRGHAGLDETVVQVDSWSTSYAGVRALASAVRDAMQFAGHVMNGEQDQYDSEVEPPLYRISQDFSVWT